jgi:hypothetical protein
METTNMRLKILNEKAPNVLQYLPYGVTTIEMRIELDSNTIESIKHSGPVYIYPCNRSDSNEENKLFVGYADESEDFLILWGAGKEKGLEVNEHNIGKRLFLQILHKGQTLDSQTISFCCSKLTVPINIIKIVPAVESSADVVRMETIREKEQQHRFNEIISFMGNKMPLYYPRWFPPRPLDNNNINYHDVEIPPITIKFKSKNDDIESIPSIDSNIDIFLSNDKIAEISGDWHYSWPHAELFTVFGDKKFIALRFWLYWIHTNYSKNSWFGREAVYDDKLPPDEQARKSLWESFNIESPDNERFDFLIDTNKKKVIWLGTDFHYQESWYKFATENEEFVKARIANDINTIEQVFRKLKDRFNQPKENYNPMTYLKEILKDPNRQKDLTLESVPDTKESVVSDVEDKGSVVYRPIGFTRKHVPYTVNGKAVAELISSVVTS